MNTYSIKLDRPRHLRLTPYSLKRLQALYGGRSLAAAIAAIKEESGLALVSRYVWLLGIDQDHELTPDKMEGILAGWIGSGFLFFRIRKLKKLERVIKEIVHDFQEKEHGN